MRAPHGGRIELRRRRRDARASPRESSDAGVGHIPEDRQRHGLVLDFSIAENIVLHDYDEPPFARMRLARPRCDGRARRGGVDRALRRPRRRPATPARRALGRQSAEGRRWRARSSRDPRLLIAAQPTRGLDVGAIEFVHRQLVEQRDAGCAVLLVSFELDEVIDLADRILVMYRRRRSCSSARADRRTSASSASP